MLVARGLIGLGIVTMLGGIASHGVGNDAAAGMAQATASAAPFWIFLAGVGVAIIGALCGEVAERRRNRAVPVAFGMWSGRN